jgi:hypothetical protein
MDQGEPSGAALRGRLDAERRRRRISRLKEIALTVLTTISPLSFPVAMIGDAANYVGKLSQEQRERFHWLVAVRMLDHALREPRYLKTATISFQTALVLDGVLAPS